MTFHQSTQWHLGAIFVLAVLFLSADFSQSLAMTASATKEEKAAAAGNATLDATGNATLDTTGSTTLNTTKNSTSKLRKNALTQENEMNDTKIKLRNNVINNEHLLDGDPDIYIPSLFSTIPGRAIANRKQDEFDEAMEALAKNHTCIRDTSDLSITWDFGNNWSLGPAASVQLLRYETKSGKAAINAMGLGLGLSARYYSDDNIDAAALVRRRAEKRSDWEAIRSIRRVHPDCRVSTFELTQTKKAKDEFYAKSALSFGLFAFVSKEAEEDTVKVDPAFTVGFLQDLLTFGVGINTHGRNRGHAFLLIGLGSAFSL